MRARRPIAVVAITRHGALHARRLREALGEVHPFVEERFASLADPCTPFSLPLRPLVARLFWEYPSLVLCVPVGVGVRLVAGLLRGKGEDPAVVTVDEAGRFAVCLLSEHTGGGEALAREVAGALGATPVVTSASATLGLPPLDRMGPEPGWEAVGGTQGALKRVMAALVNGEMVGLVQEATGPWPLEGVPIPPNLVPFPSVAALLASGARYAVLVTDRLYPEAEEALGEGLLIYRPRTLAVGVGCRRGVGAEEVAEAVREVLREHRLSPRSLLCLATLDRKGEEVKGAAEVLEVPLRLFSPDEVMGVEGRVGPSASRRLLGLPSISEACALLAAGAQTLLIPRRRKNRVTVAVARKEGRG